MRGISAILLLAGLFVFSNTAAAYPSRGAEPADGCRSCHTSPDFKGQLVVKMLRVKDGKSIVNDYNPADNTISIPVKPGGKVKYTLVLGHKESGKAKTVGWLWRLPAGVETELPNCVRKLEQGQPWTKYNDVDGEKNIAYHTVAGQTFFFNGQVANMPMTGELRVSLGQDGAGAVKLTGHTIKLKFVPVEGE